MAEDDIPMLEWKVNTTLEAITHWIESVGPCLATTKMDAMLFTHFLSFSRSPFT